MWCDVRVFQIFLSCCEMWIHMKYFRDNYERLSSTLPIIKKNDLAEQLSLLQLIISWMVFHSVDSVYCATMVYSTWSAVITQTVWSNIVDSNICSRILLKATGFNLTTASSSVPTDQWKYGYYHNTSATWNTTCFPFPIDSFC